MTLNGLYDLAESLDVEVDAFDLRKRDALSIMGSDGSAYIAIDPFKLKSAADEKSKLGHELGHCATGAFYNEHSSADLRARHEYRADKWAIRKLVPKGELDKMVENGYTEIWELAEIFEVTEDFMSKAVHFYRQGHVPV